MIKNRAFNHDLLTIAGFFAYWSFIEFKGIVLQNINWQQIWVYVGWIVGLSILIFDHKGKITPLWFFLIIQYITNYLLIRFVYKRYDNVKV